MQDDPLYLTAEAAAAELGVALPTLYAYVSRQLIRSERVAGSKARKYWRADVERLKGKGATAADTRYSTFGSETRLTLLHDSGLYFRGQSATELCRHATLEQVAALLWQSEVEKPPAGSEAAAPAEWPGLLAAFPELSMQERAVALFPMVERSDPRSFDMSRAGYTRTATDVLRWFAAIVTRSRQLPTLPLHLHLARALRAPKGMDEVIRTTLVLSADHEFDPIAYAVRALSNLGLSPYKVATAGMLARQGLRFQAQRFGSATRFLREILAARRGDAAVIGRLKAGEELPGFNSGTTPPDVRTAALMQSLADHLGSDASLRRLKEAQQAAADAQGAGMDFILAASFVGHRLGLAGEELAVSSLGRLTGWIAHAMEQYFEHEPVRPRANYVGPLPGPAQKNGSEDR